MHVSPVHRQWLDIDIVSSPNWNSHQECPGQQRLSLRKGYNSPPLTSFSKATKYRISLHRRDIHYASTYCYASLFEKSVIQGES